MLMTTLGVRRAAAMCYARAVGKQGVRVPDEYTGRAQVRLPAAVTASRRSSCFVETTSLS
jgi:hypothetical protein